ncbi:MAG: SH3 domain-containing protein [Anaerolineae bacterium]
MLKRLLILFTLALLAALALATSGLVMAQATITPIPTLTPIGYSATAAPTIFYVTTPILTPTPGCPVASLGMVIGQQATVRGGTYVRNGPSASTPFVNYYEEAVTVTIVEGPVCDEHFFWWRVRGPGNDGWVAEGTPQQYFMRPGALPANVACPEPAVLTVGSQMRLLTGVRVRAEASRGGLVLTVAPAGSLADVLEGPTCAGGYNWWRIRVSVLDVVHTGWVADGFEGVTLVIDAEATPEPECGPAANLRVGGQGYVQYIDQIPKNMRQAPDLDSEVEATLLDGIGFTIIGGPVCADGYNWWQIQILSRPDVVGWLADNWITLLKPEKGRP